MNEHTPGPWVAVEHEGENGYWWQVLQGAWDVSHNGASDPGVVADARYSAMTPAENEANARLIAAAPELLEAAKDFIRKVDEGRARSVDSYTKFSAAITKTEGTEA